MPVLRYIGWGWLVLGLAIVVNGVASAVGLLTWYEYVQRIGQLGFFAAIRSLRVIDAVFLLLVYPGLLGSVVYVAVWKS